MEWYSKLSRRDRTALFVCVLIVLVVATDRLIVSGIHSRLKSLDVRTVDEESSIKKSLRVLLRKNQVAAEARQYAGYAVKARSSEEETTAFLKDLETMAGQANVSLLYVKPAAAAKSEAAARRYVATLECEGRMEEIVSFFYRIESFPGFLRIEKFAIEPKNKEATIVRCGVTVSKMMLS